MVQAEACGFTKYIIPQTGFEYLVKQLFFLRNVRNISGCIWEFEFLFFD